MDTNPFVRGLVIGFSIAAPVGPIGILCIRQTLTQGRLVGLLTGLGAATADAIYGSIAGFGLTFVTSLLVNQAQWVRLLGGLFLCYLGIKTFLAQPVHREAAIAGRGLLGAYASTVFLTLTNPATILSFAAVFAGLGLATTGGDYHTASMLVLGVFSGSALWWLFLSGSVSVFRKQISWHGLRWLNRISGSILLLFGLIALSLPE